VHGVGREKQPHQQQRARVRDEVATGVGVRGTQLSSSVAVRTGGPTGAQLELSGLIGGSRTDARLRQHRGRHDYNVNLAADQSTGQWPLTTAERQHR